MCIAYRDNIQKNALKTRYFLQIVDARGRMEKTEIFYYNGVIMMDATKRRFGLRIGLRFFYVKVTDQVP